jgi:hypothetical protein
MKHLPLPTSPRGVTLWRTVAAALATLALLLGASQATAQRAADPPARVGRLAEVQGTVWIFDAEGNEWIAAARNRPITSGDRLSSERGGRAELRIGSSVIYLNSRSEIEFTRLDDDALQLQLHSGSVVARLRTAEAAREFALTTPQGRWVAERAGHYRFGYTDDTTEASVRAGQLQFQARDAAVTLSPGQHGEFWQQQGGTQYKLGVPDTDRFSAWVAEREANEARDERSPSARYVSPEMTGAEDLDRYGQWQTDTEYGSLWVPHTVVAGWAPYRMGHWAWVRPWGWTWVDDAPWGFAPFHYGRWLWHHDVWCWAPGSYAARPVYAPALVAWVGGPSVQLSVRVGSGPGVGWFPLAPREVYVPGYRFTPNYLRQVNLSHVPRITHINAIYRNPDNAAGGMHYRNRDLPHAMTMVPADVMRGRQPVAPAIVRMNGQQTGETRAYPPRREPAVARPEFEHRPGGPAMGVPPAPGARNDVGHGDRGGHAQDRVEVPVRPDWKGRPERERLPQAAQPPAQPLTQQPAQPPFSQPHAQLQPMRPVAPDVTHPHSPSGVAAPIEERRVRVWPPTRDADHERGDGFGGRREEGRGTPQDRWPQRPSPVPTPPAAAPAFAPPVQPTQEQPRMRNHRMPTPEFVQPAAPQAAPQPSVRPEPRPEQRGGNGGSGFAPVRPQPPVVQAPAAQPQAPQPVQREPRREHQPGQGNPDRRDDNTPRHRQMN